jgi:hypothetical protein
VLEKADGQGKISSAAKAALQNEVFYGAAEAAPLEDSDFWQPLANARVTWGC